MIKKVILGFVGTVVLGWMVWFAVDWTVNRTYVTEGKSLLLRYKGSLLWSSPEPKLGFWAESGEKGVQREMKGPGRHFYSPVWWERTLVDDIVVRPGEVGIVTVKVGKDAPSGQFIVEGDLDSAEFKGTLRRVLAPGRYRINPYGFEVSVVKVETILSGRTQKTAGWVVIPTGYVGVVTNLVDNPITQVKAGVSEKVLQAGIYPTNPKEQLVDIVEIGYRHSEIETKLQVDQTGNTVMDENGEPKIALEDSGIQFPSSDGFSIHMDFSAIWGLMPDQAPHAIKTIGNVDAVEQKIVLPQIDSILRTNGSELHAMQFLVGEDREEFQNSAVQDFHKELDDKKISLLYGLVRHVYVPGVVRDPIQKSYIAQEMTKTRLQEQLTAKAEAKLREAEQGVSLSTQTVDAETKKLVAARVAEGDRKAKTTDAETEQLVAAIQKQTAELEAQATLVLGQAEAKGKQLKAEAEAELFKLAVEAFGTPEAYNQWVFASNLSDDLKVNSIFAGQGTLWTDLKNVQVQVPITEKQNK
jgi:hypothetical protein